MKMNLLARIRAFAQPCLILALVGPTVAVARLQGPPDESTDRSSPPPSAQTDGAPPDAPASPDAALSPSTGEGPSGDSTAKAMTLADAYELLMTGQYNEALNAYRTLRAPPERALPGAVGEARCLMRLGRYDEALSVLESAAESGATSATWRHAMGDAMQTKGRYADAMEHYRTALKIDAGHDASRYALGRLLELLGRRDEAIEVYAWFDRRLTEGVPDDAETLTETARGFYRYTVLTRHPNLVSRTDYVLHQLLQKAYGEVDRGFWPARIAAANLLRAKFNNDAKDGSVGDYVAALRINPKLPESFVGLGHVALEAWQFEEVEKRAEQALEINPRYAPAVNLLAALRIKERRYDVAVEQCRQTLEINPNDLEALALASAAKRCRYDTAAAEKFDERLAQINPRCAQHAYINASALSAARQFADAERFFLRAIDYDPTNPNPRAELGLMYMETGDERKARDVLDAAWALDRYNVRTKNVLDLIDTLESFARYETEHFIVKYQPGKDAVLAPYFGDYLERAYADLCADYEVELSDKTIIEVFPTHRAFGVRITGRPFIHTIGASTGRVIALESPREDPALQGSYNWATVLRHEFTHTVTLAATANRVPHWLTEGLAVFQEDRPRSFAWCQMLAEALRRDRLFTRESISWGFIRPRRPGDRQLAYAQSAWMCEFIIDTFGYDSVNKLLNGFRAGKQIDRVFEDVVGLSGDAFDRRFAEWARKQALPWGIELAPPQDVGVLREAAAGDPEDSVAWARLAKAEFDGGSFDEAQTAATRALGLDPDNRDALTVLGKTYLLAVADIKDLRTRMAMQNQIVAPMRRLADLDARSSVACAVLGAIALEWEQFDDAERWLLRLKRRRPLDPDSYRGLAAIYLQRGDTERALPELQELARADDNDAEVPAELGRIYADRKQWGESRYWYERAARADLFNARLHEALADVCRRTGDAAAALREYETLCLLEPDAAAHFADAALLHRELGDGTKAVERARRAVELDPASPAGRLLPD